jgi:hypothetical protein
MAMHPAEYHRFRLHDRQRRFTMGRASFLASAKYSAIAPPGPMDLADAIRLNGANRGFRRDNDVEISAGPSPDRLAGRGAGQTDSKDLGSASRPLRADRTYCGRQAGLFHEMRDLPAPSPQAELKEAPQPAAEPEPEVRRSGILGWSYDRR